MRQPKEILTGLAVGLTLVFNAQAHAAPKKPAPVKAQAKAPVKSAVKKVGRTQPPTPVKESKKAASQAKKIPLRPIPYEYTPYFQGKSLLSKATLDLGAIESAEHALLSAKMKNESKVLDREQEELFYALEIRRAEKFAQKKEYKAALESFQRALNGLSSYKWIYYWSENSSKALASVCNRNKKQKDDACLIQAKRVADAFPKAASETKVLRDLPSAEAFPPSEISGDRLSQTYTEKTEKDEQAFEEVLAYFLNGSYSDVWKSGKAFIEAYPKSILRYRAMFLMAEAHTKKNDPKEAAELYQAIIDQTPISYYAMVSSERLSKPLRDLVKKDPVKVDTEAFNLNPAEKEVIDRANALFAKHHDEEVGIELDSLSRTRSYTTDFLIYLMQFATKANQNLTAFRIGNELIGRRFDGFLRDDLLNMIFPDRFLKEVEDQSKLNRLDPLLVLSLMKQESGFKAPIVSASGALGLMQLMPFTAIDTKKDLRLSALKDPMTNVSVGTKYLSSLMDKYSNNVVYSLAAYNAGPHRVAKWRKDAKPEWGMIEFVEAIPYRETRDYVMSILRNRYWYQYRKGVPLKSVFEGWAVPASPSASPNASPSAIPAPTATSV
jgi:TolA-binding protein